MNIDGNTALCGKEVGSKSKEIKSANTKLNNNSVKKGYEISAIEMDMQITHYQR